MKLKINRTILFKFLYLAIVVFALAVLLMEILPDSNPVIETETSTEVKPVLNQFGFYSDSLIHQAGIVEKNQTLSDILNSLGLTGYDIAGIVNKSNDVFDVRKIIPGKQYHAYSKNDSSNTLFYFVYEKNPVSYVVFNLNDSVNVYEGKKEVVIKQNTKSAVIKHSLYTALEKSDAPPELAIKLSQIYAWQIDFYHLQDGDNFKVIYEEEYVDSQFIGIGKILGATFNSYGKDFYAIPFTQDSTFQYFDEEGNSLRKAFLKAPLEFARISSHFSRNRLHPILGIHRPHLGVDYAAPIGTPVRTTGDGIVIDAGFKGGSGRFIKIRHNSVYSTMYMHLSKFAKGLKKGTHVSQGEVIGYVGSSGLSTGPHLDYRFFINGVPVDPLKVEVPPSHPVNDALRLQFDKVSSGILEELGKIRLPADEEKPV